MAWSFVSVGSSLTFSASSATCPMPSGTASGDLIVVDLGYRSSGAWTLPAGWTLGVQQTIGDTSDPGIGSCLIAWIVRGASNPPLTFTRTGSVDGAICATAYRNDVSGTIAVDVSSSNTLASNSLTGTTGALTTTGADRLIHAFASDGYGSDATSVKNFLATTPSTSSGSTNSTATPSSTAWLRRWGDIAIGSSFASMGAADAVKATAGSTGTIQCSSDGSASRIAMGAVAFYVDAGGGSSYTLTADSGSFTLTGQAATLTYTPGPQSYTLTADSGSFALTGQDVRLVPPSRPQSYFRKFPRFKGGSPVWYNDASVIIGPEFWDAASAGSYVLAADPGSFVLTGQPATLTYTPAAGSYTLTAASGSFSLSGQSAGLRASRKLTAAQGAFALTGIAAVLRASRKLVSAVGAFALTGQAAGLKASRKITAAQGSFSLAGQSVNLRVSRKIGAGQGSFSLSGQAAGLKVSRTLSLDAGAFVLTGQDAGLVYTPAANSYTLTADAGSFSLSGQTAGLRAFRKLTAARGTFSLTGQDVSLTAVQSPIVAIENRLFAPRIKRALRSPEVSRRLDAPGISRRHFSAEIARSLQAPAIKRKLYS